MKIQIDIVKELESSPGPALYSAGMPLLRPKEI